VVANDGSLRGALEMRARQLGIEGRVRFAGRLDAATQAGWYARARWFFSLPQSDSVSVSVLEAMAHGCLTILSDVPANRELVRDGENGLVLPDGRLPERDALERLLQRADAVAAANRAWVQAHALFGPSVQRFLHRLAELRRT